jgi:hypothetical protein
MRGLVALKRGFCQIARGAGATKAADALRRLIGSLQGESHRPAREISPPASPPARWLGGKRVKCKVDLAAQLEASFGRHRSGLRYGLAHLQALQNPRGVELDAFVERTFVWSSAGVHPHRRPWLGFIHVPPAPPDWFLPEQTNDAIFATPAWQESEPLCRGLFTFSRYHRDHLRGRLPFSVESLFLPTEPNVRRWSWNEFIANPAKKVVQVGWWLRRLHAIYQLPASRLAKAFLDVGHWVLPGLLKQEREILIREGSFSDSMYETVEMISFLADEGYDDLLCRNVVFIYLYDASANNTVVECIARQTPILVNPLPAVREYLGDDYPLYFDTLEEAAAKASDFDLLRQAHDHLGSETLQARLRGKRFLKSFFESAIYRGLRAE